jgi:hypothetical protein
VRLRMQAQSRLSRWVRTESHSGARIFAPCCLRYVQLWVPHGSAQPVERWDGRVHGRCIGCRGRAIGGLGGRRVCSHHARWFCRPQLRTSKYLGIRESCRAATAPEERVSSANSQTSEAVVVASAGSRNGDSLTGQCDESNSPPPVHAREKPWTRERDERVRRGREVSHLRGSAGLAAVWTWVVRAGDD